MPQHGAAPRSRRDRADRWRARSSWQAAERKEAPSAPDAEGLRTVDDLLHTQLRELVEDRPRDQCFQPVADMEIGGRLAGPRVFGDADRMRRARRDLLIQIRPKDQILAAPCPACIHLDRGKRRIVDVDQAALGRRYQPVTAGIVAPQYAREQLNQRFAADRRAVIKPRAVTRDADVEMPARCGVGVKGAGARTAAGGIQTPGEFGEIRTPISTWGVSHRRCRTRSPEREAALNAPEPKFAPVPPATHDLVAEIEKLGERLHRVRERI